MFFARFFKKLSIFSSFFDFLNIVSYIALTKAFACDIIYKYFTRNVHGVILSRIFMFSAGRNKNNYRAIIGEFLLIPAHACRFFGHLTGEKTDLVFCEKTDIDLSYVDYIGFI